MTELFLKKYNTTWSEDLKLHIGIDQVSGKEVHILVAFANTSREKEETLEFVHNCDEVLGFYTIWVESIQYPGQRKGAGCQIVDFNSACRDGSIFKAEINKHGIPSVRNPHCTRELKERPIQKLCRTYGWTPKKYFTVIGYRIDEPKRYASDKQRVSQVKRRFVYPLADETPMTKAAVNEHCASRSFDLGLEDFEGNCKLCYKKNIMKLIAQVGTDPESAEWISAMEKEFENYTPEGRLNADPNAKPYRFFREKLSISDIRQQAEEYFADAIGDEVKMEIFRNALLGYPQPEDESGCSESCEAFTL